MTLLRGPGEGFPQTRQTDLPNAVETAMIVAAVVLGSALLVLVAVLP